MAELWDGHQFVADELAVWSAEIAAAALGINDRERPAFIGAACAGSDRLRRSVESLLDHAWESDAAPPSDQLHRPGTVIGDCLLLCRVGRGGMGEVYKAIQCSLRRLVAVKVLTIANNDPSSALALEAISTSRLQHPNIAAIYYADLDSQRPCVVMEYVDGLSLRTWLDRHWRAERGAPDRSTVTSIVRQIALALREAHARGLVHRDLKPENVLLSKQRDDGYSVKVVDFGIARRVDSPGGQLLGTPGYIAPESIAGARPDPRSDLFSVGVVLYEILTGRHPFAGGSPAEILFNTTRVEPPRVEAQEASELFAVAEAALRKSPDDRYQTADELIAALEGSYPPERGGAANPLLSELPAFIRTWCDEHPSGFALAAGSFVWGGVSIALSIVAGAACVRVLWNGATASTEYEMIYGYLVEANAGVWYLLGASACAMAGFGILQAAHRGLARTAVLNLRPSASRDSDPLQRIAALNRRYFKYLSPAIVVFVLGFVLIPEIGFRDTHAFGWVQADDAARYVGSTYAEIKLDGRIGDLPALERSCANCRVAAVYNRTEAFRQPSRFWFAVFLISALGHQVAFTSFAAWVSFKVLFFFGLLSTALLGGERRDIRLVPDLEDRDDYRFGLGRLDNVYYAILVLLAAGSFGRLLQVSANAAKGTYFFAGDPAAALIGQPVLLLTIVIILAVLVLTPIGVFLFLTIRAVDEELGRLSAARKRLEAERARARTADERERLQLELELLRDRRATARKQSLLPFKRPLFIGLLFVNVVLLLVPLSVSRSGAGGVAAGAWRSIVASVCAACGNASPTNSIPQ